MSNLPADTRIKTKVVPTEIWERAGKVMDKRSERFSGLTMTNEVYEFAKVMMQELVVNDAKGGRKDWLHHTPRDLVDEIFWHVAKLVMALKLDDVESIIELCGDIGNGAMMLADAYGYLGKHTCVNHNDDCKVTICGEGT